MKHILLVDNYDSFTFNLHHCIEKIPSTHVTVIRNDELLDLRVDAYDKIVLSPGPGLPDEAGSLMDFIGHIYNVKPVLGVCLGHQALGSFFGAKLYNLAEVWHGIQQETTIVKNSTIFKGLPEIIRTGHYHSWVLAPDEFPEQLQITAIGKSGTIMAFEHCKYDIKGIQFHPESVLTPLGDEIIKNWVSG